MSSCLRLSVFIVLQVLEFTEILRRKANVPVHSHECLRIRIKFIFILLSIGILYTAILFPLGFFSPLSSRIRGLFIPHTRTGNPLVDSVAEHRPASYNVLFKYLHHTFKGWMLGLVVTICICLFKREKAGIFVILYSIVAYVFSRKMVRLILITAPIASICTGIFVSELFNLCIVQFFLHPLKNDFNTAKKKSFLFRNFKKIHYKFQRLFHKLYFLRVVFAIACIYWYAHTTYVKDYLNYSEKMAKSFSNPKIMVKARLNNGARIIIDDYREAYHWLRDKTPKDSRVLAWWDYGYQITGIGKRTTLADGNTWNHEHIAFVGMMLTLPINEAHRIIRHLADYVLIWAGDAGPDLRKSYHIIRITKSVFPNICKDPGCSDFTFINNDHSRPTLRMNHSVLYQMHCHQLHHGIVISNKYFELAYHTKNGLVRIFKVMNVSKESKDWVANPKNRKCDYPGSFHCPGQYPPAPEVQRALAQKTDFSQLEDFNK